MTDVLKKGQNMENQYIQVAVTLARLYGIAETLEPWEYLENSDFICIIDNWTREFLRTNDCDILTFFEQKVKSRTTDLN